MKSSKDVVDKADIFLNTAAGCLNPATFDEQVEAAFSARGEKPLPAVWPW